MELKLIKQDIDKFGAIYELFVQFLVVDGDLEKEEYDNLVIEFSDYLREYYDGIDSGIKIEDILITLSEDEEKFLKNAEFLNNSLSEDEKYYILKAITKIIYSDAKMDTKESNLFYKLALIWDIPLEG